MVTTPKEANILRTLVLSKIELEIIKNNKENGTKQNIVEKVKNDNEITIVARGKMYRGVKWTDLCFLTLKINNSLSISNVFISMVPLDLTCQSASESYLLGTVRFR